MVSPIRIYLLLLSMFCLQNPRHITWTRDMGRNIYLGPMTSHTKSVVLNLARPALCPQHLHTQSHPQCLYMHMGLASVLQGEQRLKAFFPLHFFYFVPSSRCEATDFKVPLLLDFAPVLFPLNHPCIFTRSAIQDLDVRKLLYQAVRVNFVLK